LSLFLALSFLNLFSLNVYSFPVTTTLRFNLRIAIACWILSILIGLTKIYFYSSILSSNTPWYLIPFLIIIELVRISVRPITLSFRLLANIAAGHILLNLIYKISVWILGRIFGRLELIVAIVQAYVFSLLISVYIQESLSH